VALTVALVMTVRSVTVSKKPDEPAAIRASRAKHVVVKPKFQHSSAREWRTGLVYRESQAVEVVVPPGETRFVQLVAP
jgi:hypothetical protein